MDLTVSCFCTESRTAAGLSIDARAAAVLGLALRKEIALLPIAAEKIPRLGAVDVREGDSAARRCAGDPVGEVVNQELLRRGKEPVAARNNIKIISHNFQNLLLKKNEGDLKFMMISNLLQVDFEEYAAKAKTLPVNTTKKSKLFLYGLYYQATGVLDIEVKIMLD
ncbi:unnamed protein product [Musa acuminata subsp. burmannicoides]